MMPRCGSLFASAMILGRQGQEQEGKLRLTKVLKLAHSMLGNHQMVSQVQLPPMRGCITAAILAAAHNSATLGLSAPYFECNDKSMTI